MSASPRPFHLRFTLALLGMVLFMVVGFAGLGWIVRWREDWVAKVVGGDGLSRLWCGYYYFLANAMPGDADGDGVCDGAELWEGTDPDNRKSHDNFNVGCLSQSPEIAFYGERLATRWVQVFGYAQIRWPRRFRAVVSADEPILLPKDGAGPPTKGPLLVDVNERGELEFDIMGEQAFQGSVAVRFDNAVTNESIGFASAHFYGWRTMPIPVSVDGGPPRADFPDRGKEVRHYMKWEAPADWKGCYVVEVAREDGNGGWQPVWTVQAPATDSSFSYDPWSYFTDYRGPVKLRVVPASVTPP